MNAVGVIVLLIVVTFANFVWHRKRDAAGSTVSKQRPRARFGLRQILAQVLVLPGGLLFIGGAMSLLRIDESLKTDRTTAIIMIVLGQGLLVCAVLLGKKRQNTN
jgi:hypothetical protein